MSKPNMTYTEMMETLSKLTYKGRRNFWRFKQFDQQLEKGTAYALSVCIRVTERGTDIETLLWHGRAIFPQEMKLMTPTRLVRLVKDILIFLESHEVEEQLMFEKERIFDPHEELIDE